MRKRVGALLALGVVIAVAIYVLAGAGAGENGRLRASGTVEATEADLGFNAPGRIAAILVDEGDRVRRGQELARLDRAELEAQRSGARAQLEGARALLTELERGSRPEEVAQGRASVRAAEQRLEDAARDQRRAERLFEGGAISREALDKARTAHEVSASALEEARQRLGMVESGPRSERIAAQRAVVAQAEAGIQQVEARLADAVIRAPLDGIVTLRHREPGETVPAGMAVLTVMDPDDRWVRIFVPENRIGRVSLGQAAQVTADSYPERSYGGRVVHIAREAEFTPRNVQTPEERVKLVYAVRVRILEDPTFDLKPGLPADVALELDAG